MHCAVVIVFEVEMQSTDRFQNEGDGRGEQTKFTSGGAATRDDRKMLICSSVTKTFCVKK